MRKAHVVADGEAQIAPWCGGHDGAGSGFVGGGFAVGIARADIGVEHVDFVVSGDDLACRIEQITALGEFGAACGEGKASGDDPCACFLRQRGEEGQSGVFVFGFGLREDGSAINAHEGNVFRQDDKLCAFCGGGADGLCCVIEIGLERRAAGELNAGDGEGHV